jgi:uncharacterized membrane protein YkoI
MRKVTIAALAALSLGAAAALADHDRPPTAEERARIEKAIAEMGYKSHGEVEIEGSRVEVDDVIDAQGHRYDIELDAKTLKLIHKEREHD